MKMPKCLGSFGDKKTKRVQPNPRNEKDFEEIAEYIVYLSDNNPGFTIDSLYLKLNYRNKYSIYHLAEKHECIRDALEYLKGKYSEWIDKNVVATMSNPDVANKNLNMLIYLLKTKNARDELHGNNQGINKTSVKSIVFKVVEDDETDYESYKDTE